MLWLAYSQVTGQGWVFNSETEAWAFIDRQRNGVFGADWLMAKVVSIA